MKKWLALALVCMLILPMAAAFADDFTYPMENAPDISWYAAEGFGVLNQAYATPEDSPFHTGLSEMTGVNIEWSVPIAGMESDSVQALNLGLARNPLPDIIFGGLMTDAARHMEEGTIRDLTPYIEKWAPNYYAFLQSNPAYDKAMKTDDGKYYGFGFFREAGGWNDTYLGPVVRQDWLDECGLEAPVTISDWENVLRVFKEKYDATLSFTWTGRFHFTGLCGAFGAYGGEGRAQSPYRYYVDDDGKVQYAQAQPEWLNYELKLAEWWKEGLIDQDIFTLDDTAMKSKALSGAMGISFTSMGQMSTWREDAKKAEYGSDWVGLQYPTGDDGTLSMVFGGSGIGTVVSVITGDCPEEKIETAMRLLDYAYTPEGFLYWNYGKQGVTWDYDENGEPAYLPIVTEDPDGLSDAISKYGGSTWSGSCIQATKLLYMKNTTASIEANDLWYYPNIDIAGKGKMPSGITLTAEESDEIANIDTALTTYVPEMAVKFMTGEAGAEEWDAYLAELDRIGLPRALEIRQAAYDRFMER